MERRELELYIHIPFCVKKCNYCDFLSFGTEDERLSDTQCHPTRQLPVPEVYVDRLCREIRWYGQKEEFSHRPVVSVFFGGGTPSLLSEAQIFRLMAELRDNFLIRRDAEVTMEANPGTLTPGKLKQMRFCGINRLSPVSYTHLDVYKRQAQGMIKCLVTGGVNTLVCLIAGIALLRRREL